MAKPKVIPLIIEIKESGDNARVVRKLSDDLNRQLNGKVADVNPFGLTPEQIQQVARQYSQVQRQSVAFQNAQELFAQRHAQRLEQIAQSGAQRQNQIARQEAAQAAGRAAAFQSAQELLSQRHRQRLEQLAQAGGQRLVQIDRQRESQLAAIHARTQAAEIRHQQRLREIAEREQARARANAPQALQLAGQSLGGVGRTLSVGVTAPILALGAAAVKSAVDIDRQVNVLKALTGSAEAAERRLAALVATSQKTPGLTAGLAATLDAQLRVASVSEQTIDRILPAVGRLNAVSPLGDPQKFAQNLIQLVTQNFERQDLKELVGQSPLAGEIIKGLFKVDSATNAKAIRDAARRLGLTTTDEFFAAFARAAAANPKLGAIAESLGAQFEKLKDRVAFALRPLGLAIVRVLLPLVDRAAPVIERLSQQFAALSPTMQAVVLGFAAAAAAAGPALIIFGALANALAGVAGLAGTLAGGAGVAALVPIFLKVAAVVAVVAAAAAALYAAWRTNFGGVRDLVERVGADVRAGFDAVVAYFKSLAPIFNAAVKNVFDKLSPILEFFSKNAKAILLPLWDVMRGYWAVTLGALGDTLKAVLQVLAGDIAGAEKTMRASARRVVLGIADEFARLDGLLTNVGERAIQALLGLAGFGEGTGRSIGAAIVRGFLDGVNPLAGLIRQTRNFFTNPSAPPDAPALNVPGVPNVPGAPGFALPPPPARPVKVGGLDKKGGARVLSEFEQLTKQVREAEKDVRSFLDTGSREFRLRLKLEDLRDLKSRLEEIVKLRREAGLLEDAPLPQDAAGARNETERLKALLETRKLAKSPQIEIPVEALPAFRDTREVLEQYADLEERIRAASGATAGFVLEAELQYGQFQKIAAILPLVNALRREAADIDETERLRATQEAYKSYREELEKSVEAQVTKNITEAQRLRRALEKNADLARLSDAEKGQLLDLARRKDALDYYERQQEKVKQVGDTVRSTFQQAFRDAFERGPKAFFDRLAAAFKETLARLAADLLASTVFRLLFGGNQASAGAGATPGFAGLPGSGAPAGGGFGGIFGSLLGGGGQSSGGGGLLGSLFGGGEEGGSGGLFGGLLRPGGTGGFAGPLGSSGGSSSSGGILGRLLGGGNSSGGGLFGKIGGLFGLGGASASSGAIPLASAPASFGVLSNSTSLAQSAIAAGAKPAGLGAASGLASLASGGLLLGGGLLGSLAGGKSPVGKLLGGLGGTLGAGFLGASGVFGSGVAAALPALLSNPFTAIIAGGLIGAAFLVNKFSNTDLKSLNKQIKGAYGVDVKDNNVLKQIKEIGKNHFGKDQFPKKHYETVRLEEVKQIVAEYAAATGQNARGLTLARDLQNASNPLNQFVRREYGGPVTAGQPYIVGEKRAELFVPSRSGTILPSVPRPYGGDNSGLERAVAVLADTVAALNEKIEGMPPDAVLAAGHRKNPKLIPNAVRAEQSNNADFSRGFARDGGF